MRISGKIVTIGLCPCWDMVCRLEGVDWGQHKVISSASSRPAGKALNISRALAWMGTKSTAAGLWGREDYEQMLKAMRPLRGLIKVKMTAIDGSTRWNITVVDTVNNREMHLRAVSRLASKKALRKLKADLQATVNGNSVCVFAGSMPEKRFWDDVVRIINCCRRCGARIALDTSGDALREIVNSGPANPSCRIWLIKPNVEELCELLGEQIEDRPAGLAKAGRKLLDKVEIILISRGKKGSVVVTKKGAWQGQACTPPAFLRKQEGGCASRRRVLSTVGCGDYLLAGFLKGLKDKTDPGFALETAIKVATAKAWGWTEKMAWEDAEKRIEVSLRERK